MTEHKIQGPPGPFSPVTEVCSSSHSPMASIIRDEAVPAGSPQQQPTEKVADRSCSICCETELAESQLLTPPGCVHTFCASCWQRHLVNELRGNRFPVRCMVPRCSNILASGWCLALLVEPQDRTRLLEVEHEASIPQEQRAYCPIPTCAQLFRQEDPNASPPTPCPHCRQLICLRCQQPWHNGQTCRKAKESSVDAPVLEMAQEKRWRQCPSCRQMVEKRGGCNAIRCKCSAEFCYVCGKSASSCECWSRMSRSQRILSVIGGVLFCCFCCPCVTGMVVWECCHHE